METLQGADTVQSTDDSGGVATDASDGTGQESVTSPEPAAAENGNQSSTSENPVNQNAQNETSSPESSTEAEDRSENTQAQSQPAEADNSENTQEQSQSAEADNSENTQGQSQDSESTSTEANDRSESAQEQSQSVEADNSENTQGQSQDSESTSTEAGDRENTQEQSQSTEPDNRESTQEQSQASESTSAEPDNSENTQEQSQEQSQASDSTSTEADGRESTQEQSQSNEADNSENTQDQPQASESASTEADRSETTQTQSQSAEPSTEPNPSTQEHPQPLNPSNPDKPNPDKPNPDKPNPDKPNPDKPTPSTLETLKTALQAAIKAAYTLHIKTQLRNLLSSPQRPLPLSSLQDRLTHQIFKTLLFNTSTAMRTGQDNHAEYLILQALHISQQTQNENWASQACYWLGRIEWYRDNKQTAYALFDASLRTQDPDSPPNREEVSLYKSYLEPGHLRHSWQIYYQASSTYTLPPHRKYPIPASLSDIRRKRKRSLRSALEASFLDSQPLVGELRRCVLTASDTDPEAGFVERNEPDKMLPLYPASFTFRMYPRGAARRSRMKSIFSEQYYECLYSIAAWQSFIMFNDEQYLTWDSLVQERWMLRRRIVVLNKGWKVQDPLF
ncbi:hypothetical protein BDV25DRAFT_139687 [Aspergillus avenaceus]|uniref:Uncharacterized protein n=1 Tax=Aspergillus avenaceus TaxID=36643 RepID=A0A5N6TW42_ASPAV|nr:hypothetical protein BDV25DRAFT_139687 [Aspergillus avenaceus]